MGFMSQFKQQGNSAINILQQAQSLAAQNGGADAVIQQLADNFAQTNALEQYLAPVPRPAYVVQNPNCCQQGYGCGCGFAA